MRDHKLLLDQETESTAEEAWFKVSQTAYNAGWVEDWLNDPRPETITWLEYICDRIRTSNIPRD